MRVIVFLIAFFATLPRSAAATEEGRFAIQASHSGASNSVGLVRYEETFSGGVFGGYSSTSGAAPTQSGTIGLFLTRRLAIQESTYLTLGGDVITKVGTLDGLNIDHDWFVAPSIGVEQYVGTRVIVNAWVYPYSYENQGLSGNTIITNSAGLGGIGLSFLF